MSNCYLYVFEIDEIVRYIGRSRTGGCDRVTQHFCILRKREARKAAGEDVRPHRFYDRLAHAMSHGAKIVTRKIHAGLSGDQAIKREFDEIAKHPPDELWNTIVASTPRIADTEWRARQSAAQKTRLADPDRRRAVSEQMKRRNSDPAVKEQLSAATRRAWSDPEKRDRRIEAQLRAIRTPEGKARRAAKTAASWQDPVSRRNRSEGIKKAMQDPDYRARRSATQRVNLSGSVAINRAWWAAEGRTELLLKLRAEGKSYSYIAERIGTNTSRASDRGRRLGLPRRSNRAVSGPAFQAFAGGPV